MTSASAAACRCGFRWAGLPVLLLLSLFTMLPASADEPSLVDDGRAMLKNLFAREPADERDATRIRDTRSLLVKGVYRVGARVDFHINDTIREALDSGVPLVIVLQVEVLRKREWMWPETVARLQVRYTIEYHALSQRYRVENHSSGEVYSFSALQDALDYIGTVYDLPVIDANLLQPHASYLVRMRAVLDIESLPTPIRLWAYMGSDWSLGSDWYQWPLKP